MRIYTSQGGDWIWERETGAGARGRGRGGPGGVWEAGGEAESVLSAADDGQGDCVRCGTRSGGRKGWALYRLGMTEDEPSVSEVMFRSA